MTDTVQEEKSPPAQAVAIVRPTREVRVVESDNPIMSTAGFEHLLRVARIMAESGMMSETLTHEGPASARRPLPNEVVLARAFIIGELASRIDESPISVMQCASFVHGKMMLEGKFVDAMLTSKFGIKTQKDYGKWDAAQEKTVLGEEGVGDQLGIIVSGMVNGRREEVHGYVGGWKTSGNNSPWKPGSMRKMLGNRGVREFARAHEAGAILGIIGIVGDDEFDQDDAPPQLATPARRGRVKQDVVGKLAGPGADADQETGGQARAGFSRAHVAAETGEGEHKEGVVETKTEPHDAETGEVIPTRPSPGEEYRLDADEEVQGRFQVYKDGQPLKQVTDPTKFQVYDAHPEPLPAEEVVEEEEEQTDTDEAEFTEATGHAEPGEKYLLGNEQPNAEGRYTVYLDGKGFSTCTEASLSKYAIYGSHPPAAEETREEVSQPEAPAEEGPGLMDELAKMTSWLDVKQRVSVLNKDPDFAALPEADQNKVRAMIWTHVERIKKEHRDPVDFGTDATAFRLWIETQQGQGGADAIEGTFRVLRNEAGFKRLNEAQQAKLRDLAEGTADRLRGRK